MSTTPITQFITEITYQTNDKPKAISQNCQLTKTSSKETATMKDLEKRKQYMKEYVKQRRKDSKFKKTEIERKKSYNTNYKNSNPEKIKELWQKASALYRKSNPEKVKESCKRGTNNCEKTKQEKNKESRKRATLAYRKLNPENVKESNKKSSALYGKLNSENVKQ